MKVLNLYAGIGGNRKLWQNVEVTAVEINPEIAAIYQENFPQDKVVVGDAHQYLLEHYKEFDFIWSSPPCPTHSDIRRMAVDRGVVPAVYPDMGLYQEIILLMQYAECKWAVENVFPYYKPLIPCQLRGRHCFWSNFIIPEFKDNNTVIIKEVSSNDTVFGFSLIGKKLSKRKDQILRNCVNPDLGLHVFESAFKIKQMVIPNG